MALLQWYQIAEEYVILKFGSSLDASTFINDNFLLANTDATPSESIVSPFDSIVVERDYQSISRELSLYWNITLEPNTQYTLTLTNLKDIFGNTQADYSVVFETTGDIATPNISESDFTKEPTNIEDYSIKTPDWGVVNSGSTSSTIIKLIDIAPGLSRHHYLSVDENKGKIDLLFDSPIAMNYVSQYYFILSEKTIKSGASLWNTVDTMLIANEDSTIVSVYLPGYPEEEGATPASAVYSYLKTDEEIEGLVFFKPSTKYKMVISGSVGL